MKKRELTPRFVQAWGILMFCHGFIATYVFDDGDAMAMQRGNQRSAEVRSNELQKRWLAHLYLRPEIAILSRDAADEQVFEIVCALKGAKFNQYPKGWFERIATRTGLRSGLTGKHFARREMPQLVAMGTSDLPPLTE